MKQPVSLSIVDIVGSGLCIASDDGQKVYDAIAAELRAGNRVRMSFKNVEALTSAFLNVAFGQLYGEFSEQQIKAGLSVADGSPDDMFLLKRVVDRSKEFFKDPDRFHAAAKEVLGDDDGS
jgi:hypothetical protein